MDIVTVVQQEIVRLEQMQREIERFMKNAPQGCLKWQKKNGTIYYYYQYWDEEANQWKRKYIKKKESEFAMRLAQKNYFSIVKPKIEKQILELRKFVSRYPKEKLDEIYESLSEERKQLVRPLETSVKEKFRRWENEQFEINDKYPENLRYETEQGELVRSKSEVIIANMLYQNRKHLMYKYERPLNLSIAGKNKIFYPDFTIFNMQTGKITYWEHAGRMDDPNYANDFVKKVNTYISNGFIQGQDVIISYESQVNPLDIHTIKCLIQSLVKS